MINAQENNTLIFVMNDGREISKVWKLPSRSKSWTEEMREKARQRYLEGSK